MSRIAFTMTGFITNGDTPSLSPLKGWYWYAAPIVDPINPPLSAAYPVEFSALDLVHIYWNFQQLTSNYDLMENGNPVTGSGMCSVINLETLNPIANELELVKFGSSLSYNWNGSSFIDPTFPFSFNLGVLQCDVIPDPTKLYPALNFVLTGPSSSLLLTDQGNGPSGVTITSSTIPSINGAPTYSDSATAVWTGTISLEATLWWGYDGVFDTSTGTQLIIPVPDGL